jgi:hypothetical protein
MKLVVSRDETTLERRMMRSVNTLNASIESLIKSMLSTAPTDPSLSQLNYEDLLKTEINHDLLSFLSEYGFDDHKAIEYVVEYVVRRKIFGSIHLQFFEGKYIFGVGSRPIREYLEGLMSEIIAMGKSLNFFQSLVKFNLLPWQRDMTTTTPNVGGR